MKSASCVTAELMVVMNDQHDDPQYKPTVEHLSDCPDCQRILEQMAADDWWWVQGQKLVQSSVDIPTSKVVSTAQSVGDADLPERWSVDFLEAAAHPELLGQLGKYQIEKVVGRGGMGIVLKGYDTELNRTVAIKVLAPHLASNGTARQRFAREARAAAAVVHDHVVAIHGIEASGDLPYLVMPFIGGEPLQKHIDQHGALEAIDIVRIAMQIASGLSAAHEQGLVHRDVKPANIMLENGFGRVRITDFGLARAADDASITRTGLVAGTPHYMSPEQANGDAVDQRSDLFSLGSVMYSMATGRTPFRAAGTMAVLNAICHKQQQSVQDINTKIPRPLDEVITRLLKKQPDQRYESATELRTLLAEYLAHLQDPLRRPLPKSLRPRWSRQSASLVVLAAACVLIGIVAFVGGRGDPLASPISANQGAPGMIESISGPTPASSTSNPVAGAFDVAVQELESEIAQLEAAWAESSRRDSGAHAWDQSYLSLQESVSRLERDIKADNSGTENPF